MSILFQWRSKLQESSKKLEKKWPFRQKRYWINVREMNVLYCVLNGYNFNMEQTCTFSNNFWSYDVVFSNMQNFYPRHPSSQVQVIKTNDQTLTKEKSSLCLFPTWYLITDMSKHSNSRQQEEISSMRNLFIMFYKYSPISHMSQQWKVVFTFLIQMY